MDVERLFSESPEFLTNRLILRRLRQSDANDYFSVASDAAVTIHTMWETHQSLNDSREYIKNVQDRYDNKKAYHWGIIERNSRKLIGRTGFIHWDVNHQKTEIGFVLSREYWNQGIITEATKEIVEYGLQNLSINRIEGRCNHDNEGSARIMEKLGMVFEGVLRKQLKIKGEFIDQKMYSILKSDILQ